MISNKNVRINLSVSFTNSDYHDNMTLLMSFRRLTILKLQQEQCQTFTYENSPLNLSELANMKIVQVERKFKKHTNRCCSTSNSCSCPSKKIIN